MNQSLLLPGELKESPSKNQNSISWNNMDATHVHSNETIMHDEDSQILTMSKSRYGKKMGVTTIKPPLAPHERRTALLKNNQTDLSLN